MGRKISEEDYLKIRKNILKKMYAKQAFSKGHILVERLRQGIPPHLYGFVPVVLGDLLKVGLVIHYGKTKYGDAYQLNIEKLADIENVIFNDV